MTGKVYDCPKCGGNGYMLSSGDRCTMCGGKRKAEDGGRSVARGVKGILETQEIGSSNYRIVLNMNTRDGDEGKDGTK